MNQVIQKDARAQLWTSNRKELQIKRLNQVTPFAPFFRLFLWGRNKTN